jgi:anti-sigma factor RsiW
MSPNDHQPTHDVRCREFVELITDLLEGRLAVDERDVVERHLAMCTWCQTYLDQMRHTLAVVGRLGEDDVPPGLVASLAHVFRARGPNPSG